MTDFKLEQEDYYIDPNGNMVFTAVYLKKRKFCCKSGCRHCPYGFGQEIDPNTPTELLVPSDNNEELIEEIVDDSFLEKYKEFLED